MVMRCASLSRQDELVVTFDATALRGRERLAVERALGEAAIVLVDVVIRLGRKALLARVADDLGARCPAALTRVDADVLGVRLHLGRIAQRLLRALADAVAARA